MNAYNETGANSVNLLVPEYKDKDFAVEVGAFLRAQLNPALSTRIEAGVHQSLDKGGKNILTSLEGAPVKFSTIILGRSPTAAHLGAAVSGQIGPDISAELGYRGYFSPRMSVSTIEARVTFKVF